MYAAREQAIATVRQINPGISENCLKAQLDKFYVQEMNCGTDAQLQEDSGKAPRVPENKQKRLIQL